MALIPRSTSVIRQKTVIVDPLRRETSAGVMNRGSSYFTLMGTLGKWIHTQNGAMRLF